MGKALMSAQIIATGAGLSQAVLKKGGQVSTEIFKYDFVSLILKLVVFFTVAYIINKIFEAIIFGQNTLSAFAGVFGINLPSTFPEPIVNFFQEGINGFRFWDVVKALATLLVIFEWFIWYESERKVTATPSPMTQGVFAVIVAGLALITFPEIFQRLKEIRAMTVLTTEEGRVREFR